MSLRFLVPVALTLVAFLPAQGRAATEKDRLVHDFQRAEKLRAQGKNKDAPQLYRPIPARAERLFGPENPRPCDLLNNYALVQEVLGNYAEAGALYRRCVRTAQRR